MNDVIETRDMSKWFGEVVAVNNLNLSIGSGVTGLLGPNGAGKTTLIRLVLGLYRPSRGTVRVFGEQPRNNLDVLRRMGYCPESDKFYDNMTGYEFVYWMNRFRGMNSQAARTAAERALETVKMTDRMDDYITEYSRGMRQRTKIAQALVLPYDVLLLDEPMAGLDPEGREDMFALIRRLGDEGETVIVSSHVLYEIERVTDNVVLLYQGRVLAHGHIREIRDLIDEHPHAVTVASPDPHGVADLFVNDESTLNVEFSDGTVTVRTSDPNSFYQKLNDLVLDRSLDVTGITCPDDNLQSVYDYLVERGRASVRLRP